MRFHALCFAFPSIQVAAYSRSISGSPFGRNRARLTLVDASDRSRYVGIQADTFSAFSVYLSKAGR
jgi:hypothetical protein